MPYINHAQVQQTLPHRAPILLVDEVLDWSPAATIHARRHVSADDPQFAGHYPGEPIFPGVLLVEALAQASGLLVNLTLEKTAEETIFLFMQIDQARFRRKVCPGDTLDLHVTQTKNRLDLYWFNGHVEVAGQQVAAAAFSAKHVLKKPDQS